MNSTPSFIVDLIKNHWTPGKKILEIGCGPAFLKEYFPNDYIGTDITNKQYNDELARKPDIICSAENLLIESGSFDIVVIKSSFFLFDDPHRALKEAQRVLRSKGVILIFDYTRKTQKILQKSEPSKKYPCWTQWGLKKRLLQAGYVDCQILSDKGKAGLLRAIRNELTNTWAIVQGRKY